MHTSRNPVLCLGATFAAALALGSFSVHAQDAPGLEDGLVVEIGPPGNLTTGPFPVPRQSNEERIRQIFISEGLDPDNPDPGAIRAPDGPSGLVRISEQQGKFMNNPEFRVDPEFLKPKPRVVPSPAPDPSLDPAWWRTPEFGKMYSLGMIRVEHRYAKGATGKGTLGAIYDSGIDLAHTDVARIRTDLSHKYGPWSQRKQIDDTTGHGTAVYGIAGASRNGLDIHGVAPDAQFMILKQSHNPTYNDFRDSIRRVTSAGADVMNNSWGWPQDTLDAGYSPRKLLETFGPYFPEELRQSALAGVSMVFATGNESGNEAQNFARLPVAIPWLENVWIAVTALNTVDDLTSSALGKAPYANACGTAMNWCLAAPGEVMSLQVTGKGGGVKSVAGTSFAAPHVAGAVLVLKSQFPELSTREVHEILFDTAVDLGAPGVDPVFGHGALNLGAAISPQGAVTIEYGRHVDERTALLSSSFMLESEVTDGVFTAALSDRYTLVTDRYDRGFLAALGPRISTPSFSVSPDLRAGLSAAFRSGRASPSGPGNTGLNPAFDSFGPNHDVTRIAHADPVMGLVGQSAANSLSTGTGFSMQAPVGKGDVSMAHVVTADGNALSLGAGLPFGEGHSVELSLGRARETDSILGARAYGAFAGLNSETLYGRVQADVALGERVTLNGSLTAGQTSFHGNGLIADGQMDARSMALGLTVTDALARGDKLSIALARPFAVSGGEMILRGGTDISATENGRRTNRIALSETAVLLGEADRAPELHLGYLHGLDLKSWDSADLAFGGVTRLDGGMQMAVARVALTLGF